MVGGARALGELCLRAVYVFHPFLRALGGVVWRVGGMRCVAVLPFMSLLLLLHVSALSLLPLVWVACMLAFPLLE